MRLPKVVHPTNRPNFTVVTLDGGGERELWLAFSYETCVGFMLTGLCDRTSGVLRRGST
jgi:hypothetical protein